METCKALGLMQHAQYAGRQGIADPRDAAQRIGWMKRAVERLDLAAKDAKLAFQQAHAIDLDDHLELQMLEVDSRSMEAVRLHCGSFETIHQFFGKRTAVGMVAAGVFGNKTQQCRAPGFGDGRGIKQSCRIASARLVRKSGN